MLLTNTAYATLPATCLLLLQHKEDKMQRTASQFQEMEQTVYNSLFTLIKDTSVLRDYAAAALLIINVSAHLKCRCL
jgi:hypothetical protein